MDRGYNGLLMCDPKLCKKWLLSDGFVHLLKQVILEHASNTSAFRFLYYYYGKKNILELSRRLEVVSCVDTIL